MKRLVVAALIALAACGAPDRRSAAPGVREVVIVFRGSSEPLPFDPRAGRMAKVTSELAGLVGHGVVLELDGALSPSLKDSLEATVLATFENLVRELVLLRRDDPDAFAAAKRIERIVCRYDALAKESEGKVDDGGRVLTVRAPADRFPILERGVVTEAVWSSNVDAAHAKWGDADPAKLSTSDQAAWFAYMLESRPGYGYLWMHKRGGDFATRRLEHAGRILRLAAVVTPRSELDHRVKRWLLEAAGFVANGEAHPTVKAYDEWLARSASSFDDDERLLIAKALFRRDGPPERAFPSFDRVAFGLSAYDDWARDGGRADLPPGPRGELWKIVLCPEKKMGAGEIRYGCSAFFASALRDPASRGRLGDVIARKQDARLLELALLNPGSNEGANVVALVDRLAREESLFQRGVRVLFEEYARRDDVKGALEEIAPRWWRDLPARRGLVLLVLARRWEHLDVHYGDNQWERFPAEYGGAVGADVLSAFLAEGPRAVEMTPKIWPALAKGGERDRLVAQSLPALFGKGSARAQPAMLLLKKRYCDEHDGSGMALARAQLARREAERPDDVPLAPREMDLNRCAVKPKDLDDRR